MVVISQAKLIVFLRKISITYVPEAVIYIYLMINNFTLGLIEPDDAYIITGVGNGLFNKMCSWANLNNVVW